MASSLTATVNAGAAAQAINAAIGAANDLPSLIAGLKQVYPSLAQQLTGKGLLLTKSSYGPALIGAVSYAAALLCLHWDDNTCAIVAGFAVYASSTLIRRVTNSPITGWLRPAPIPAAPAPAAIPGPAAGIAIQPAI